MTDIGRAILYVSLYVFGLVAPDLWDAALDWYNGRPEKVRHTWLKLT
jgi:hypothetical protein